MLASGSMLGPYEILALLGKGGMGEVYRALDTRLQRTVALKVLSEGLATSGEFRERFSHEARIISTLSHPNIGSLYDIGSHNGIEYLVLEYLEGETLESRLGKGKLRLAEALNFAVDIASALDAAHRVGIIHRDVKPGNIMITRTGAKLMDFGLAKPLLPDTSGNSPVTIATPITREGSLVGTLQYMSPEQMEGQELTPQTDIFSFGTVLYEMVTGQCPFQGGSPASLIVAVLQHDPPPIRTLDPILPTALERTLHKCLNKEPEKRWNSAADLRDELRWISESGPHSSATATHLVVRKRALGASAAWAVAVAALLLAAALYFLLPRRVHDLLPGPVRFSILPPEESGFTTEGYESVAMSPDGENIAFTALDDEGKAYLWVRSIRSFNSRKLQGTEGGIFPFWSPDSKSLGFFAKGKLRKISIDGGTSVALCDVGSGTAGGTWNTSGEILVGDREQTTSGAPQPHRPISMCSETNGGSLTPLLDNTGSQRWPFFLPDNKHFLYLSFDLDPRKRAVMLASTDSKQAVRLLDSPFKANYGNGYLFFVRDGTLLAQKLDLDSFRLKGEPSVAAEHVSATVVPGVAGFSVAHNGAIAFLSASEPATTQLTWISREGTKLREAAAPASDVGVSLASDEKFALVGRVLSGLDNPIAGEAPTNIWHVDFEQASASRLTFGDTHRDENPILSPKADRFIFASHRGGGALTFMKSIDGERGEQQIMGDVGNPHPIDWSPDGRYLLFHVFGEGGLIGLSTLDLNGPQKLTPYIEPTGSSSAEGQFSPDGRFIAYMSDESGRPEIYVQTFPANNGKWQVSVDGGVAPRWRADGKELYFVSPASVLMAAPIRLTPFEAGRPTPLFRLNTQPVNIHFYGGMADYAPSRDGKKFLINDVIKGERQNPINIVLNWSPGQSE